MKLLGVTGLLTLALLPYALWGMGQCTKQKLNEVEDGTFIFGNWPALYQSYSKVKECDSGGDVSEGYSESVVRLLADHWDKLPELVAISSKHSDFKKFVLRHIDATTSDNDLKKILQISGAQCPSTARSLCATIGSQAEAAIKESNEVLQKGDS